MPSSASNRSRRWPDRGALGQLFAADIAQLNRVLRKLVFSRQLMRSIQEPILFVIVVLGFMGALTLTTVPATEALLMLFLMGRAVMLIGKVQQQYQIVVQSESAYGAIHKTITEAQKAREVFKGTREPGLARGCSFDRVSFSYGTAPVLQGVSLNIPAGATTAVTGPSGAGKTTVADLLLALYLPNEGEIRIDDVSLAEIDVVKWRRTVGYVPRETILFHDTVLRNLTLGDSAFGEAEARAALGCMGIRHRTRRRAQQRRRGTRRPAVGGPAAADRHRPRAHPPAGIADPR